MTWFLVDDQMHLHKKFRKLGKDRMAATGVWATCGSWASDAGTEGFVPAEIVQGFDPREKLAQRLVDVGLWVRDEDDGEQGYRFHDHEDWRPSSATPEDQQPRQRSPAAERQARKRARDRASTNGHTVPCGHRDSHTDVTPESVTVTRDSHARSGVTVTPESRVTASPPSPGPPPPGAPPVGGSAPTDTKTDTGSSSARERRREPRPEASRVVTLFTPHGIARQVRRDLGFLVEEAVEDGASWTAIEHALVAWSSRSDCTPGLLPHLVTDAVKAEYGATPGRPAIAPASPADATIARLQALKTGSDGPVLTALPGGQP